MARPLGRLPWTSQHANLSAVVVRQVQNLSPEPGGFALQGGGAAIYERYQELMKCRGCYIGRPSGGLAIGPHQKKSFTRLLASLPLTRYKQPVSVPSVESGLSGCLPFYLAVLQCQPSLIPM